MIPFLSNPISEVNMTLKAKVDDKPRLYFQLSFAKIGGGTILDIYKTKVTFMWILQRLH